MSGSHTSQNSNTTPNIDITSPYTPRRPSPIVSISLNNPIGSAFRKIKNFLTHKQTLFSTSFTIKITPIVAIVSLAGVAALFGGGVTTAYNFGKTVEQKFLASATPVPGTVKISPTPTPVKVSKTGTIKATYQNPPTPSPITITSTPEVTGSSTSGVPETTIIPSPTLIPPNILHYILVERSGSIIFLSSKIVTLSNYLNVRVLVTGTLNSTTNTLTIAKASDIEVLQ